jgi:hypothetical protein
MSIFDKIFGGKKNAVEPVVPAPPAPRGSLQLTQRSFGVDSLVS